MGEQDGLNKKPHSHTRGRGILQHNSSRRGPPLGQNSTNNRIRGGFKANRGRSSTFSSRGGQVPDGTVPAAYISPFQASRPQSGQHSASVVRTSVSGPSQQQILFYSSVQRRGGVFTKTAHETTAQLARTGVLPNSTAFRKRARHAMESNGDKPETLEERFSNLQSEKTEVELRQAKKLVKRSGINRFEDCDSDGADT
ncbi:uncharacterized protein TEOVI_000656900 [Trypanosoma equiperdum]|uniref:Uncharacterized protein n=2 Tax=Trypanozoon TaxID=39700 RepID=Q57YI5_TRYB2|nr:hypothetical protein, conserved [Trypanosoma brucei brucei TREU927]AAX69326.1 hypothetical protein, conserved [Trypanosoma brucei]AAZ13348.1 hypothetical protein, conserved [Trypanosoma brucei brucei TREU927]SCU65525.1 hypothetical protein, conserved [Trypanosoma equiperdum]